MCMLYHVVVYHCNTSLRFLTYIKYYAKLYISECLYFCFLSIRRFRTKMCQRALSSGIASLFVSALI